MNLFVPIFIMPKSHLLRLHFIVFLWGFTALFGKLITVDAHVLVFYRMLFTAFILFVFIRFWKKTSLVVSRKVLFQLATLGAFMGFHWLFFFTSIKVSNVSIALSCLSLSTLFASFLEPIIFKRTLDWREVLIGIVIVLCIGLIFKTELQYKEGIIYGILCAFCGTVFSVCNGIMVEKTSSDRVIFYEIFIGFLVISLYYLVSGQLGNLGSVGLKDTGLVFLLAGVFTAYPMQESVNLMKYISPFTLILTVNLEPVYGIILAHFLFGESEHMSSAFYFATAIMIGLIVLNGIMKARRTARLK